MTTSKEQMKAKLERANAIATKVKNEGREFTPAEAAEVNQLLDEYKTLKGRVDQARDDRALLARIDELAAGDDDDRGSIHNHQPDSLANTIDDAGWNLKSRPAVVVPMFEALKASTLPSPADLVRTSPVLVPKGTDRRFLWPKLQRIDAGHDTSVQDFRQTARTLTGTVKRALDATTDKASLDVVVSLVNEALAQFAVVIPDIPNAVLESAPAWQAFLGTEGRFQVEKAIDDHVLAQIVAAAPPFGTTGTTLVDRIRNGIASMRATGTDPNIVVLNPTDAASLDLTADAGGYVFPTRDSGSSSPLWGLTVVERIGAGNEPPYLIDTRTIGALYGGPMHFGADPFTAFNKNLTTLRVECKALFHVRNAEGARRIAAT